MQLSRCKSVYRLSGGNGGGATPVPIPNTEVKPSSADGTALVTVWESRSLPEAFLLYRTCLIPCFQRLFIDKGPKIIVEEPCNVSFNVALHTETAL
jgi:hypothetical protein